MSKKGGELWREIEETRLVKPAFELLANPKVTAQLAVPQWMDREHIDRLQAILRWGTRDRVVKVFENVDEAGAGFDGVAILKKEPDYAVNRATDGEGNHLYGRVKDGDAMAQIAVQTWHALLDGSAVLRKAVALPSKPLRARAARKEEKEARGPWLNLYLIASYLPVKDPVYLVDAMDRLIENPKAAMVGIGIQLLIDHVKKTVAATEQDAVWEIIRRMVERRALVLPVGKEGVSVKGAKALDRAYLGRYNQGPKGLDVAAGMQLVVVDAPVIRSVI